MTQDAINYKKKTGKSKESIEMNVIREKRYCNTHIFEFLYSNRKTLRVSTVGTMGGYHSLPKQPHDSSYILTLALQMIVEKQILGDILLQWGAEQE